MRKKILYSSDPSHFLTGFGRHSKFFLKYFYSRKNEDGSPKYEVVEAAQALREDDVLAKSKPWKCIGLIPANDEEVKEGQPRSQDGGFDPNLGRLVAYGAANIEKVLKQEKPTVFINCQDYWGFQVLRKYSNQPYKFYHDCEWFDKFPCVLWHPQDSLPSLPLVTDNAHKVKNMWVKASFAKNDLHRLGFDHVDLFPLLLDTSMYREYSDEEKKQNRLKYKIAEDEKVFLFCFRNQGRKKVGSLIEGFKIFIDNNPGVKAKLILITNPFEGWDIKRLVEFFKLDPDLVLVPHICADCKTCEYLPITTAQLNCPACKGENLRTITIEKGLSEQQLIDAYNFADGYLQPVSSGGFEAPCLESMMCGCPLATVNYSFGESFVESGEVFELDYTNDFEHGSGFLKAAIKPESIAEFMQLVHDEPVTVKERGSRGRNWAEKTFNPYDILARIENFIDSLPDDHGYDFDFITEYPYLDAKFSEEILEKDWIIDTYLKFFGVKLTDSDQNYLTMERELSCGATRESVYQKCKEIAERELRKRGTIKADPEDYFLQNGKKRLLYEMAGDYGDSLLSLAPLEALRKLYPAEEWDIYISCLPQYQEIYAHLDFIAGFVPFVDNKHFEFWEGKRGRKKIVDIWLAPNLDRNYIHNSQDKNMFHPNFDLTKGKNVLPCDPVMKKIKKDWDSDFGKRYQ